MSEFSSLNQQEIDTDKQKNEKNKIQIPISWREELYMVKEKVLEEIESVFNECMEIDQTSDEKEKEQLLQMKNHFKKRLKGFYSNVIVTFRDNVEYSNIDETTKRKRQQILYTQKQMPLQDKNNQSINQFKQLIIDTEAEKKKMVSQIQDQLQKQTAIKQQQQQQQLQNAAKQSEDKQFILIKGENQIQNQVDLVDYIKQQLDDCVIAITSEQQKALQMYPHLTNRLKQFHLNTRRSIKKTIELQYALDSIQTNPPNLSEAQKLFSIPQIPQSLFD